MNTFEYILTYDNNKINYICVDFISYGRDR